MNLKIGITGGIGSGKTFVCKKFEEFGIPVYYADTRAKWLMENSATVKAQLTSAFGKEIFDNNKLDRKRLASIVFNDKKKLKLLNSIVHPAVATDTENWEQEHKFAPYLIKEAALLFETGSYKQLDKTILVHAPKDIRLLRVMQRDHVNKEAVEARIKNQMAELDKMEKADFIINNDGQREIDAIVNKLNMLFSL